MLSRLIRVTRYANLAEKEFVGLAHEKLEELTDIAERVEDEDVDINHSNGILTIKRSGHTIVVNLQTPNRQLWYSSTISGPQRYDWSEGRWVNSKAQIID